MDVANELARVNEAIGLYDSSALFEQTGVTESASKTTVRGRMKGKPVRLEFEHHRSEPRDYAFEVWLYDDATGESLGRGNGGRSFSDAISIYQWNNAILDLDAL